MPSGASTGSARASAALYEPFRRLPQITRTSVTSSSLHPADKLFEPRELLLDKVDTRLVLELQRLLVELLHRHADEDFRPQEYQRLDEHHDLAPLILHPPAAERTAGDRLQRDWLVLERLVFHPREPVDCVLQAARNAVIVFRGHDHHTVGGADRITELGGARGKAGRILVIRVVDRQLRPRRRFSNTHALRRPLRKLARERGIKGAFA